MFYWLLSSLRNILRLPGSSLASHIVLTACIGRQLPEKRSHKGQGGRQGDVVGGLLSTEEGVDRLRSLRALAPWEVWRVAAGGGVVSPRSWKALGPREVWRCGTKGDVDRLRLWTALAPWEVWRSFQSQGIADCWVNKNSLRSMLSSKN